MFKVDSVGITSIDYFDGAMLVSVSKEPERWLTAQIHCELKFEHIVRTQVQGLRRNI